MANSATASVSAGMSARRALEAASGTVARGSSHRNTKKGGPFYKAPCRQLT